MPLGLRRPRQVLAGQQRLGRSGGAARVRVRVRLDRCAAAARARRPLAWSTLRGRRLRGAAALLPLRRAQASTHCHLLLHMDLGMFREVRVDG